MAFCLAYPALMAELIIGRHARANSVSALQKVARNGITRGIGTFAGFGGMITSSLILSFYGIVAGWMLAYSLAPAADLAGLTSGTAWLTNFSVGRNFVFTVVFMLLTIAIICAGVKNGIERWSSRLMPALLVILVILTLYVLTLDGANALPCLCSAESTAATKGHNSASRVNG